MRPTITAKKSSVWFCNLLYTPCRPCKATARLAHSLQAMQTTQPPQQTCLAVATPPKTLSRHPFTPSQAVRSELLTIIATHPHLPAEPSASEMKGKARQQPTPRNRPLRRSVV